MIRAAEHAREPAIGRRLRSLEWLVYRLDRVSRLNCVVHAEVAGPLTSEALRAGLNAVQRRHPLARVRIVPDGRRAARFVVGVPEIPMRIADVPADAWVEQLEREVHTALPVEQGPLLRAVWLRHPAGKATVLMTFHHAIGDGLSGAYLLRDLVQAVAAGCEGYDVTLPALPSLPSVQERFPAAARGARAWWRYVRLIVRILRDVRKHGMPEPFVPDATAPLAECRMRTRPYRFEPTFTRALVARARAEETTVSGALIAALARAVARAVFGGSVSFRGGRVRRSSEHWRASRQWHP
ncbi:MAG: hypothetical protein JXA69_20470, partial [Phycisphaerae bacterium]|nr:hypothetical protein [Phycisphaerae bacterium]